MKEVNELLNRLGELENAPLIWINKKVYDMAQEIERLNNIINEINNAFEDKNIHNNMELVRKIKNIVKGVDKDVSVKEL